MKPGSSVLVAMSGGVDSSVAACLLKQRGYDVVGVFMRLGAEKYEPAGTRAPDGPAREPGTADASADLSLTLLPSGRDPACAAALAEPRSALRTSRSTQGCCSAADAADARRVAGALDIPFYALNFEREFDRLVDYFVDEYANARTPNPCIRCNQWLKFGRLAAYADAVGAEWIATGHYARIERDAGRPRLRRARHTEKDQSYVLFGIPLETLSRTRFPLGELTKDEVRSAARRFGLALHDKPESQDICFVPDGDYARLVRARRGEAFRPGKIQHVDGRLLGSHTGVPHFTVGQRRGLRVALGEPLYVTRLDAETDTVTVGPREAVCSRTARVDRVSWLCAPPRAPIRAEVQIRYHHTPAPARVTPEPNGDLIVRFDTPQSAVTPGQAAVFYAGDEVLGGGWIEASQPH